MSDGMDMHCAIWHARSCSKISLSVIPIFYAQHRGDSFGLSGSTLAHVFQYGSHVVGCIDDLKSFICLGQQKLFLSCTLSLLLNCELCKRCDKVNKLTSSVINMRLTTNSAFYNHVTMHRDKFPYNNNNNNNNIY
jgi:hypothetical protein